MNNETRKIFVLVLTAFIIVCAFVPALNSLPTINNSTSKTPLIQLYTDQINSSHASDVEERLQDAIGISGYGDEYLLPLDNLIFILIGILLAMFLIGVINVAVSKKNNGFVFIRIMAILNSLVYSALIVLTFYQSNKLSNDTWGVLDGFIKITPSTGTYIGFVASFVLVFIAKRERVQANHACNIQNRQNPPINNEQINSQAQNSVNISDKMNETMIEAKGKVDNFLANQKEKIRTEYETVEKDFKGLGLEDIISSSREFCYRNRILKYIMPYIGIILIIQTVIVGMTMLFGLHSYSRFSAVSYIINSNIFYVVVVALCLIKKNYSVVAAYETLLIVLNFILCGGFNGGFIGTFAWINMLVMIVLDVYAIKMILKNRNLNAYKHIQEANIIQEQIICPSCGKSCVKGMNFCNECGNKLR